MQIDLNSALLLFHDDIAQHYRKHEETFDLESFHGRFHIIRCLILADLICNYYISKSIHVNVSKTFIAVLFHDIAREDNGIDLWEKDSAIRCFDYLVNKGFEHDFAFQTSKIILKSNLQTIEEQILYDVDVLDYNRFFLLPVERDFFDNYRLLFADYKDITSIIDEAARKKIIEFSQQLIMLSYYLSVEIDTANLVAKMNEYYTEFKPW